MKELEKIAKITRNDIVDMIYNAKSGHLGGSLSCVEIIVALYYELMNLTIDQDEKRVDKFILSKGHAAPAYYSVLASKGYIPKDELKNLRKETSFLEGHPSNKINGVDVSSGSLGQGLSIANGMAISKKLSNKDGYVYCLLGDGELEEGQVFEALMTSNKYKLSNVIVFIDNNNLQIDGTIDKVKGLNNIKEKITSFGFNVQEIDGHNFEEIINSVNIAKISDKPNLIIARTIKGKGISFMENNIKWHGKSMTDEEYKKAKYELK